MKIQTPSEIQCQASYACACCRQQAAGRNKDTERLALTKKRTRRRIVAISMGQFLTYKSGESFPDQLHIRTFTSGNRDRGDTPVTRSSRMGIDSLDLNAQRTHRSPPDLSETKTASCSGVR